MLVKRLLFVALSAYSVIASAHVVSEVDTSKVMHINEVTVEAERMADNQRAAAPIQILSKTDMEKMGLADVSDALKHFAGVQVKDYGGVGGLKTVAIRGLGAQHTGVNYDGVQVGDLQSGQIDISRFTLENVSMLYLTIGQQDDIYQSAKQYASAGTLNIVTDADSNILGIKAGSYGLWNPSALLSQHSGKFTFSEYASYQQADGNFKFHMMNGQKAIDEKRNNSDIATWRAELNMRWNISDNQMLKLKGYLFDSKRGLPGSVIYDNTYAAERLTDRNYMVQALYENKWSQNVKMKAAAKWSYSWMRDFDIPAAGPKEDKFRQNETYLTATIMAKPWKYLDVSVAEDFQHNYLSTTLAGCPYPSRNTSLTALAARYHLADKLTATASALYTLIDETVKEGEASKGWHRMSPAISMSWKPWKENLRIRLSYKDIFRTPTLNDLYYRLIGNTNLKPEKTRQWNLGATWNKQISKTLSHLAITADVYRGRVSDKIVAVPTMFVWKMQNLGEVHTLGVDATMTAKLQWGEDWSTDLMMSYNYLQAEDKTDKEGVTYNNQIAYTPKNSGSSSLMMHTPWADITYNILYTGTRYTMNYNGKENHMNDFVDHSISISRVLRIGKSRLRLQADALNLGGKNYEVIRFYPMPGRNYRVMIQWKF